MGAQDLLDRARDARRRRDEAAGELMALEGLEGVGMLDGTQKRELGRLRERPRAARVNGAARTRKPTRAGRT